MSQPPDHEEIARRLLDLWQDQVAKAAHDPDLGDILRRQMLAGGQLLPLWGAMGTQMMAMMQAMQSSASNKADKADASTREGENGRSGQGGHNGEDSTSGARATRTATADAASLDHGDDQRQLAFAMAELARSVSGLSERLDRLEQRLERLDTPAPASTGARPISLSSARSGRARRRS